VTPRDRRVHSTRSTRQRSVAGTPEVSLRSHPCPVNVSIHAHMNRATRDAPSSADHMSPIPDHSRVVLDRPRSIQHP
jgi:hypothetical protein